MSTTFQLVHYVPNLLLGGRMPVAAMLLGADAKARLVRAVHLPDEHCLGGHDHVAALNFALARLERDPGTASTAALKKKFRPEKPGVPYVAALRDKGLKPISHWVFDGKFLLLLEPLIPKELPLSFDDIATTLGAYRFHLRDESSVMLGVYMLPGGSQSARNHAKRSLQCSAHRVFDTADDADRSAFVSKARSLGEANDSPLLH